MSIPHTVVLASQLVTFNSSQPQSSSVLLHANAEHTNRVTYSCTALHTYPIAATKSFPTCVAHGTFYNPPSYRSMPLPPTSYTIVGCDALLLPLLPGRFFVQRSFTRPSLKYTGYVFFFLYFHFFLFFFFFFKYIIYIHFAAAAVISSGTYFHIICICFSVYMCICVRYVCLSLYIPGSCFCFFLHL